VSDSADGPLVLVADGPDAVARTAADLLVAWLAGALAVRNEAHVALTGGSSARGLYAQLRDTGRALAVDWSRVHLWVGDERIVPTAHADSNLGLALRELADADDATARDHRPPPRGPARARFHGPPVGDGLGDGRGPAAAASAAAAAAAYAGAVEAAVSRRGGDLPVFDVVLLGVGGDGHILSVFPGSVALEPRAPLAMAIPAPTHIEPHLPRVTLDPALVGVADHVLLSVAGAGKAPVLREIFGPVRDVRRWPAQLALTGRAVWLLDPAAAAGRGSGA
jgi:6-phosphogluconolactonase